MVSTESGSFTSARTIVQLYLDNKDLGQVCFVCDVVVVVVVVVVGQQGPWAGWLCL